MLWATISGTPSRHITLWYNPMFLSSPFISLQRINDPHNAPSLRTAEQPLCPGPASVSRARMGRAGSG